MKTGWYKTIEDVEASLSNLRRRKNMTQAIYMVMRSAGKPMATSEIAQKLREEHSTDASRNAVGQTLGKIPWIAKAGHLRGREDGWGSFANEAIWALTES